MIPRIDGKVDDWAVVPDMVTRARLSAGCAPVYLDSARVQTRRSSHARIIDVKTHRTALKPLR